ncbi:MAG: hypothetical protein RIC38_01620 [Chromatocurvus sp.]
MQVTDVCDVIVSRAFILTVCRENAYGTDASFMPGTSMPDTGRRQWGASHTFYKREMNEGKRTSPSRSIVIIVIVIAAVLFLLLLASLGSALPVPATKKSLKNS